MKFFLKNKEWFYGIIIISALVEITIGAITNIVFSGSFDYGPLRKAADTD